MFRAPQASLHAKETSNIFFVAIYTAEALLKIFALGWKGYWKVGPAPTTCSTPSSGPCNLCDASAVIANS